MMRMIRIMECQDLCWVLIPETIVLAAINLKYPNCCLNICIQCITTRCWGNWPNKSRCARARKVTLKRCQLIIFNSGSFGPLDNYSHLRIFFVEEVLKILIMCAINCLRDIMIPSAGSLFLAIVSQFSQKKRQ